ncbi:MAG: iron ABC transporter permease [Verrucomicrobiae bacterium]|nr:iron ABC transporter permease [Verrucomicrobiae bacterium]
MFFAVFFLYPIWNTVQEAFFDPDGEFTLSFVGAIFRNPIYLEGLINAFKMGLFSTIASLVIALPLALVANRYRFPGKDVLTSLLLVPMILPPFVGALGIRQFLGQTGVLNTLLIDLGLMNPATPFDWMGEGQLFGVVLMNALHLYPIAYLNISAALANLDPAMEEAAENLGCHGLRRLWRVTLPLIMPGVFAGSTIIFIWSFTELGVPLIFDYGRVTSVQIFDGIKELSGNPLPYALVVVMLGTTVVIYAISKWLFGRENFASSGRASTGRTLEHAKPLTGWLFTALFAATTAIAILPHVGVILLSVAGDWYGTLLPSEFTAQHYIDALGHPLTVNSIGNSLKYASFSTLFDITLGIAIAYVVVRTRLPGRHLLDALAMLPLAVPGLVLAFGYFALAQEGQAFDFLILGEDPVIILVIAYAVRRLPYVVRSAAAGYQQTSVSLEEAAQNLGCTPWRSLQRVTLPLITANLIAGGLLAFSFAMLEVSDSLILAEQAQHFPITKAIYALISALGNGHYLASALGVWAMLFLATTIIGAGLILGQKMGALFRV